MALNLQGQSSKLGINAQELDPDKLKEGKIRPLKKTISIFWVGTYSDTPKLFRCFDCGWPMFRYFADVGEAIPGNAPMEFPIEVLCKNNDCGRIVRFEAIVRREVL